MIRGFGQIVGYKDGCALIKAPVPSYVLDKQHIRTVEVWYEDGRTITPEQRKKIHATLREIGAYMDKNEEYVKWLFKAMLIAQTGCKPFSLRNCTVSLANDFLNLLIDHCIDFGIITDESLIKRTPDIGRYLYRCLATRKCAICQRDAHIHHVDAVGMGNDRDDIVHLGLEAAALCPEHHRRVHDDPDFMDDNHIFGIKLDEHLCKVLKLNAKPRNPLKAEA